MELQESFGRPLSRETKTNAAMSAHRAPILIRVLVCQQVGRRLRHLSMSACLEAQVHGWFTAEGLPGLSSSATRSTRAWGCFTKASLLLAEPLWR